MRESEGRTDSFGERAVAVVALAAFLFIALAMTGTLPLSGPTEVGATQYCTQYQYNAACTPLVPPLIAFTSNRDGVNNQEIYIMNSDGSAQTRVFSNTDKLESNPSWSPDGPKIAFGSTAMGTARSTDECRRLRRDAPDDQCGQRRVPRWSPDGTKIAFDTHAYGTFQIYVMNADGSGVTRLTNDPPPTPISSPSWSPDGTQIAFVRNSGGNSHIYVMNANGSGQTLCRTQVPLTPHRHGRPDGTKIAFISFRDGNNEIYVVNADGSGVVRLTNNAASDINPAWSPDGTKIAFTSIRDGNAQIYVMNADGSGQTRLTNDTVQETTPTWQLTTPGRRALFRRLGVQVRQR